jgi:hypothetical protein
MSQPVNIHVPTPCHESWAAMKPEQQGRFCSSCSKTVVDFSSMSDRQLFEYFRNYSGGACGRFSNDQLNRDITARKPQRTGWFKYVMSVLLPAMLLTSRSQAQGEVVKKKSNKECTVKNAPWKITNMTLGNLESPQMKPQSLEFTKKPIALTPEMYTTGDTIILPKVAIEDYILGGMALTSEKTVFHITGMVKDQEGNPVPFVTIMAKGSLFQTLADKNGKFKLKGRFTGPVTLIASAVNYEAKEQAIDPNKKNNLVILNRASLEDTLLGPVIVEPEKKKKKIIHNLASKIVDSVRKLSFSTAPLITPDDAKKNSFIVYPNPVTAGTLVRATLQVKGAHWIQVLDVNGMMMQEEKINAQTENSALAFYLYKNILPGYYTLLLTDEKRKKIGVQKLIVQ